ncbi:15191_t:CDS:1, partial [Cetraspora pellucida]
DLDFFQTRNIPIALFVFSRIERMQEILLNGITNPQFTDEMAVYISQNHLNINYFKEIFEQAFNLTYTKFTKHVRQHDALLLFKSIQCFNPQFIHQSTLRHNLSDYSNIPEFQHPSNRLIDEWKVYCKMDENFDINNEFSLILENYWKDKLYTLP